MQRQRDRQTLLSQIANQTYIIYNNITYIIKDSQTRLYQNPTLKNTVYINYLQELLQFATEMFDRKKIF